MKVHFITGKKTDKGCQCPFINMTKSDTGNKIFQVLRGCQMQNAQFAL